MFRASRPAIRREGSRVDGIRTHKYTLFPKQGAFQVALNARNKIGLVRSGHDPRLSFQTVISTPQGQRIVLTRIANKECFPRCVKLFRPQVPPLGIEPSSSALQAIVMTTFTRAAYCRTKGGLNWSSALLRSVVLRADQRSTKFFLCTCLLLRSIEYHLSKNVLFYDNCCTKVRTCLIPV
jgi:hypothetical protein